MLSMPIAVSAGSAKLNVPARKPFRAWFVSSSEHEFAKDLPSAGAQIDSRSQVNALPGSMIISSMFFGIWFNINKDPFDPKA
jgi:hypothetical protein